jgi:hypothetical protein
LLSASALSMRSQRGRCSQAYASGGRLTKESPPVDPTLQQKTLGPFNLLSTSVAVLVVCHRFSSSSAVLDDD